MKSLVVRIGIIGSGRITERFIAECRLAECAQVVAIYNRHLGSAQWLAQRGVITEEDGIFLTDDLEKFYDAVDAVYVAAPHEYHVEYTKDALFHGKHVLCEKPMAFSADDIDEIEKLAEKNRRICMEAIKTAYAPGFQKILELVAEGTIGTVRDIDAAFTKIANPAGREMWSACGGSFRELGSYVLLPVAKLYGDALPKVHVFSLAGAPAHDSYTKIMLAYADRVATIRTGLGVKSEGELLISGDRGYIRVPSPWWLTKRIEVHHEDPDATEIYEVPFEGSGLRYEISAFAERVGAASADCEEGANNSCAACKNTGSGSKGTSGVSAMVASTGLGYTESRFFAAIMEQFAAAEKETGLDVMKPAASIGQASGKVGDVDIAKMNVWAHRGCCMRYPENTILAFKHAAEIPGLTGIELDTQLSKDGEVVIIHDEKLDRTTDGTGNVCDYTLEELRAFHITGSRTDEVYQMSAEDMEFLGEEFVVCGVRIPTLREVLQLLVPYMKKNGLRLNIELKNSVLAYEGMEQKVIDLVAEYGAQDYIVYSSFNHSSLGVVRSIDSDASTGALADDYHECLDGYRTYQTNAIHPGILGLPVNKADTENLIASGIPVRTWNSCEPFFGESRVLPQMDLREYARLGMTEVFTNVPEDYLDKTSKNQ